MELDIILRDLHLHAKQWTLEFSAGSNPGQTESIQLRFLWNWCFRMAAVQSMCKILHKQNVVCTYLSAGSGHQGDDFSHVSAFGWHAAEENGRCFKKC